LRLLLDEMLSDVIARELQRHGHDVVAIQGSVWEGSSDPDVLLIARSERRALVTNNVHDFRPLHQEAVQPGGAGRFGMVFMPGSYRRSAADVGRIVRALETKLAPFPGDDDLANAETWL
jgi:hypothetical protein